MLCDRVITLLPTLVWEEVAHYRIKMDRAHSISIMEKFKCFLS